MFMGNDLLTHEYELTVDELQNISDNGELCV